MVDLIAIAEVIVMAVLGLLLAISFLAPAAGERGLAHAVYALMGLFGAGALSFLLSAMLQIRARGRNVLHYLAMIFGVVAVVVCWVVGRAWR